MTSLNKTYVQPFMASFNKTTTKGPVLASFAVSIKRLPLRTTLDMYMYVYVHV